MKRALSLAALGLGGLVLAVALSLGTFALAGNALREPITHIVLSRSSSRTVPTATPSSRGAAGSTSDDPLPPQPDSGSGGDD